MTAYDWTLLALFYFGIGNAWACAIYRNRLESELAKTYHPAAIMVASIVGCFIYPVLFIIKLCRTKWVRCEA